MEYLKVMEKDRISVVDDSPEKRFERSRITLNKTLKPPPPVIQIDDKEEHPVTIMTEGNISMLIGKAKSRKSFAVALFTATSLSNDWLFKKLRSVGEKWIVYFDTEQSSFYVQQAYYRVAQISKGSGVDKRFFCHCLRPYNAAERIEIIEWAFENIKGLGLVVIDGIRDLVKDINSPEEATEIASKLLKWSENSGAHILTVLHENKSDGKARGHIGSELVNKAETIMTVSKLENDPDVSKISCNMMRSLSFEPIYFTVNDNLPEVLPDYIEKAQASAPWES